MHTLVQICHLSLRDYLHERLLSACAVLGLAAVLAPLLILFGVKFGVVETLTERLRSDPATLEISPVGSGHFSAADMERWRDDGRVAFVMPRTRTLAATVELLPERGTPLHVSMEPTGHDDPLLARHALPVPALLLDSEDDPDHPGRLRTRAAASGVVLSAPVAERLGLRAGDQLTGRLERTRNGKVQAVRLTLKVIGVLPLAAQQKNVAYVPLPFLEAAEDFRDGRAVPLFGPEHAADGDQPPAERLYAGFRMYARSLDDVAPLRDLFRQQGITVHTEAEAIDQVRRLSTSLDIIFLLIGGAAAAGFTASTTSSTLAAVRRKQRLLGLLRLGGFSTLELLLFPLLQALLTAVLGTGLALGLYAAAQGVVNRIFAAGLDDMEQMVEYVFHMAHGAVSAAQAIYHIDELRPVFQIIAGRCRLRVNRAAGAGKAFALVHHCHSFDMGQRCCQLLRREGTEHPQLDHAHLFPGGTHLIHARSGRSCRTADEYDGCLRILHPVLFEETVMASEGFFKIRSHGKHCFFRIFHGHCLLHFVLHIIRARIIWAHRQRIVML